MRATIVESVIGVFGFGEDNELVEKVFFPEEPQKTAERLQKIEKGTVITEISSLVDKLRAKGYTHFVFENQEMARNAREKLNIEATSEASSEAGKRLRENLEKFALELEFVEKPEQLRARVHNVSIELAKMKVKTSVERRDLLVAQAVQTVDDLDKSLNVFMSRVREWFGLHYPELDRMVDKHETSRKLALRRTT